MPYLKNLNECITKIKDIREPNNFKQTDRLSQNAIRMALHCAGIYKTINAKGISPEEFNVVTYADELGIKLDRVEEIRKQLSDELSFK